MLGELTMGGLTKLCLCFETPPLAALVHTRGRPAHCLSEPQHPPWREQSSQLPVVSTGHRGLCSGASAGPSRVSTSSLRLGFVFQRRQASCLSLMQARSGLEDEKGLSCQPSWLHPSPLSPTLKRMRAVPPAPQLGVCEGRTPHRLRRNVLSCKGPVMGVTSCLSGAGP